MNKMLLHKDLYVSFCQCYDKWRKEKVDASLLAAPIRNNAWTGSSVGLYVEPRTGQVPTGDGLGGKIVALDDPS